MSTKPSEIPISPAKPRGPAPQQAALAMERWQRPPLPGPRERQRERITNRLQGGRCSGRDAPKASGGAPAPVRVGPAGAPLEGAGPSTTDPTLAANPAVREIDHRHYGFMRIPTERLPNSSACRSRDNAREH